MPNSEYLTPSEVVSRYKGVVTLKTLANWRVKREGPQYTKIGGKILYAMSDILEWEKLRKVGKAASMLIAVMI